MIRHLSLLTIFTTLFLFTGCADPTAPPLAPPLSKFSGKRMTIDYQITVGDQLSHEQRRKVEQVIDTTLREVNERYNNWNPSSELSKLNASQSTKPIAISPQLEKLLYVTDKIVKVTEGLFDPTVAPLQKLWRAHLERGKAPAADEIAAVGKSVGWNTVHLSPGYFRKEHPDTTLDLGGIAKGYCVDLLVENLNEAGFANLFVDWGGEIRTSGNHPDHRPWRVLIRNPASANPLDNPVANVPLQNQALATSGDYWQFWSVQEQDQDEQIYFHIINPQTRHALRMGEITSVSVLTSTCAVADGLATAGMIFEDGASAKAWAQRVQEQLPNTLFWIVSRQNANSSAED